jgi:hypothetical protein
MEEIPQLQLPNIFGYDIAFDGPPPEEFLPIINEARDLFGYANRSKEEHINSIKNNIKIPPIPSPPLPKFPEPPTIGFGEFIGNKKDEFENEANIYLSDISEDQIVLPSTIELPEI